MKPLSWQHVAVIFLILASIVTLGSLGRDTAALIGLGIGLLASIGLLTGQIKDAVNGNITRLIYLVESLAEQLKQMPPPTPPNDELERKA